MFYPHHESWLTNQIQLLPNAFLIYSPLKIIHVHLKCEFMKSTAFFLIENKCSRNVLFFYQFILHEIWYFFSALIMELYPSEELKIYVWNRKIIYKSEKSSINLKNHIQIGTFICKTENLCIEQKFHSNNTNVSTI